jgi:diguanylate cyclase (GGDEF)-like protein
MQPLLIKPTKDATTSIFNQPSGSAVIRDCLTTSSCAELLAPLKGYRFLSGYSMTIYHRDRGPGSAHGASWQPIEKFACSSLCGSVCTAAIAASLDTTIRNNRPMVFRCPAGLLAFAVPIPSAGPDFCLVGGGVREQTLDLHLLETLAENVNIDPFDLLEQLEKTPVTTREEFEQVTRKVCNLVPSFMTEMAQTTFVGKTEERLRATVAVSADIDQAESAEKAVSLLSEALGILFDIPGIAVATVNRDGQEFLLRGTWGASAAGMTLAAGVLTRLFPTLPPGTIVLEEDQLDEFLPGIGADRATCFPLFVGKNVQGMVTLVDTELGAGDLHLVELLAGRLASRLAQLEEKERVDREKSLSARLLTMISTLALAEGTEQLYRSILEMSAELVHATCGSLMFLDEAGENLHIEAAIGMNPNLARSLVSRVGSGIAGKVAESGHPMLVNDIEQDTRIATPNRPRFKTKSFISAPLRSKERTIGVLNLSDKENRSIYTEMDLELLVPFVDHAAALVNRVRSLERADLLEKLSVTDPLTELFNRRFLEKRMDEELNRGKRHGQQFTVMMIDLDHFKIFNDLNGHVAGDKALKKAARIVRSSVREMDVVTRYGGEEFCVVLPDTSKKESSFVADRIRRSIEKERFAGEDGLPIGRLTASIGVSAFPEDGDTAAAITMSADTALYRAKAEGRNRIVYSPPPSSREEQAPSFPMVSNSP